MNAYLLPGILGLLLGLVLHWTGLSRPDGLRCSLALRRSHVLRSTLHALGMWMLLTALLCWLAVIDVDGIAVLPLSAGALAGGALFGIAAGLCGYTPLTAFAGLGGGHAIEALCTMAGCLAMALALPLLDQPLSALQALPPHSGTTLFRMTLDESFLLGGGFLGQGCAGLLLLTIAACIPSNRRPRTLPEAPALTSEESAPAPEIPPEAPPEPIGAPPALPAPETPLLLPAAAPEETFVALLPCEEPLIIDTQLDEEDE